VRVIHDPSVRRCFFDNGTQRGAQKPKSW